MMQTQATDTCKGHDPLKIKGYRTLTEQEIDLMNEVKALGVTLDAVIEKVGQHIAGQVAAQGNMTDEDADAEVERLQKADPALWLQTGRLKLQEGLMNVTRAVAQPTFF